MRRFWDEGMLSREVPGPGYGKAIFIAPGFVHAQPYCNFVVLEPRWLPEGCTTGPVSVRTEGDRWSTVHFRLTGRRRQLRIKQFFYDWSNLTDSATNLQAPGQPFAAQGTVGWVGVDYKGLPAACWNRLRTQVEISVLEGEFSVQELESLCAGMYPADPTAVDVVALVPFARISFTVRRGRGPWGNDRIAGCSWTDDVRHLAELTGMPRPVLTSVPAGFAVDSMGWRRSRRGMGGEFQLVLRHTGNRTDVIHLRGTQPGSTDPVSVPPGPDLRRQFRWTNLDLRVGTAWFGTALAQVEGRLQPSPLGGWSILWQEAGANWECSARASTSLSPEALRDLVNGLRMEVR